MESETRVVEADEIAREIGPAIDGALAKAASVAAAVVDDESYAIAIDLGVQVRTHIDQAEDWRKKYYEPARAVADNLAGFCDPKIKQGKAILKLLASAVSAYDLRKRREAQLAKERAEAEAKKIQEDADRKKREAEEAERRAKQAAEDEKKRAREAEEAERQRAADEKHREYLRKREAEAAEARAAQAQKEAAEKAEMDRRRAEQAERDRKLKEEEEHRMTHAQTAEDVGNADKVSPILSQPTPIAPVAASPTVAPSEEQLAIEADLARQAAAAKAAREQKEADEARAREQAGREQAERDRAAREEAQKKKAEMDAEAERTRQEAAAAQAAAAAAKAAASSAISVARPDDRIRTATRWRWELDSDGTPAKDRAAFLLLAQAVLEGRAPIEYLGFDPKAASKFRPAAVNKDVQDLKEQFVCPGLRAFPQNDVSFKA